MQAITGRWWQGMALLAVALLLVVGTTPRAAGQELAKVYVGNIVGGESADALIAVVVAPDGKALAYVCSNDNYWNESNSRWYTGEMNAQGALTGSSRDENALNARAVGDALSGTVGGLSFNADLVTSGTAGLFRGRAGEEVHAVIEAADGKRVGGVWHAPTGRWAWTWNFASVPPAESSGNLLRLQRPANAPPPVAAAPAAAAPAAPAAQQQFVFVELTRCVSSFDQCGNI